MQFQACNWTNCWVFCYLDVVFFLSFAAQEFLTHEGYFVPDNNGQPPSSAVGRGDVARFMLSLLNSNAWVKKGVAITTK